MIQTLLLEGTPLGLWFDPDVVDGRIGRDVDWIRTLLMEGLEEMDIDVVAGRDVDWKDLSSIGRVGSVVNWKGWICCQLEGDWKGWIRTSLLDGDWKDSEVVAGRGLEGDRKGWIRTSLLDGDWKDSDVVAGRRLEGTSIGRGSEGLDSDIVAGRGLEGTSIGRGSEGLDSDVVAGQ